MAKRRMGRYPNEFRRMAVERLKTLREHRGAVGGAWRSSAAVVQVARSTGADRRWRGAAAGELARVHAPQRDQPAKATAGREDPGGGFFQRCLAKSRGSTPEAAVPLARRHLRPNPGSDAYARQPEYRANVSAGGRQPGRFLSFAAGARSRSEEDMEVRSRFSRSLSSIGAATAIGGSAPSCGGAGCW